MEQFLLCTFWTLSLFTITKIIQQFEEAIENAQYEDHLYFTVCQTETKCLSSSYRLTKTLHNLWLLVQIIVIFSNFHLSSICIDRYYLKFSVTHMKQQVLDFQPVCTAVQHLCYEISAVYHCDRIDPEHLCNSNMTSVAANWFNAQKLCVCLVAYFAGESLTTILSWEEVDT